jgi:LysR family glycine cleavage system transcriptional activator
MDRNLNLNWLRTFEAASRLLSFTAASKELGMTQTAVSLQIKALETKLGQDLFIRRPKSLQLTEIAKAYIPSIRETLEAFTLSTNGLFGPNLKSAIVVRASMAAIIWLAPKLGEFQELHPEIGIKLVTAIWADTIDTQDVDVDIILAPNDRSDSALEKLSVEYIVPICGDITAPSIKSVGDLTKLNPIHILGFDDHWSRYMAAFDLRHDVTSTQLMVDTSVAACELAASDLGCAVIIERFAKNAVEKDRKVMIVGEAVPLGQSHYIADQKRAKEIHPAAEAFKEWLRIQFA